MPVLLLALALFFNRSPMLRIILIGSGFLLLLLLQYIAPVTAQMQFYVFVVGILLLGIPHGAADLLVANKDAGKEQTSFSTINFLVRYILKLTLFAATLWFFPLVGNILFILFAAYHFGETDLYKFRTDTLAGKLFITSYGLLILGVILLHHFDEVMPMYAMFKSGTTYYTFIQQVNEYRYQILSVLGVSFFGLTFYYFSSTDGNGYDQGQFLIQLTLILFILFNLPILLGFTFYFVVWHSVLSLKNIVGYLRNDNAFPASIIIKQIGFYSMLALVGTVLFGAAGFMFTNTSAIVVYVFLALAVLTAPHMQIMHSMYCSMRRYKM